MAAGSIHKSFPLHFPPLLEIKEVIEKALKPEFKELSVEVCDCPDLTQMPWDLACGGLGGETATFHFGGVPYLLPVPDKSKVYDMQEIPAVVGVKNPFVIGAGAALRDQVGINSELMANVKMGEKPVNKSWSCKMEEGGKYNLQTYPCTKTGALVDLFVSEGTPAPVIKIHAKQRTGNCNIFMSRVGGSVACQNGHRVKIVTCITGLWIFIIRSLSHWGFLDLGVF